MMKLRSSIRVGLPTIWLVVVALSLLLIAGRFPIGSSSEGREAQVVKELFLNPSTWLFPLRNGLIPSKPPFFHWLGASFSFLSGQPTVGVIRAVSAFAFVLLLITIINFVKIFQKFWLKDYSDDTKERLTLLALSVGTINYLTVQLALNCRVDMLFAAMINISLLGFFKAFVVDRSEDPEFTTATKILFIGGATLTVLTKGFAGVVMIWLVVGVSIFYLRGFKYLGNFIKDNFFLIIAPLVLTLPWFVYASFIGGESFIVRQLLFENIWRFFGKFEVSSLGGDVYKNLEVNNKPFWFYIVAFVKELLPWSLIFIFLLLRQSTNFENLRELATVERTYNSRVRSLPLLIIFTYLALLSLASGKRSSYLLPIVPLFSLYLAFKIDEYFAEATFYVRAFILKLISILPMLIGVFAILALLGLETSSEYLIKLKLERIKIIAALLLGGLILGGLIYTVYIKEIFSKQIINFYIAFLTFFALLASIVISLKIKNQVKNFVFAAERINGLVPTDERVVVVRKPLDEFLDPLVFYLPRSSTYLDVALAINGKVKIPTCPVTLLSTINISEKLVEFNEEFKLVANLSLNPIKPKEMLYVYRCF
jgi:hypothetical protein